MKLLVFTTFRKTIELMEFRAGRARCIVFGWAARHRLLHRRERRWNAAGRKAPTAAHRLPRRCSRLVIRSPTDGAIFADLTGSADRQAQSSSAFDKADGATCRIQARAPEPPLPEG